MWASKESSEVREFGALDRSSAKSPLMKVHGLPRLQEADHLILAIPPSVWDTVKFTDPKLQKRLSTPPRNGQQRQVSDAAAPTVLAGIREQPHFKRRRTRGHYLGDDRGGEEGLFRAILEWWRFQAQITRLSAEAGERERAAVVTSMPSRRPIRVLDRPFAVMISSTGRKRNGLGLRTTFHDRRK